VSKFLAIVGREWRNYFLSPIAYVMLATFMFLNGLIFWRIVAILSEPGVPHEGILRILFSNSYFWFFTLFVVPVIAMRLFPEERKSGTFEVLLTSPVSEGTVVLGKFLGALGFYLTLWVPSLVFVWILRANTSIDFGAAAASYLGVALLGAYFLSIATLASTFTKNQIVAAIIAFAMLIPVFSTGLFQAGYDPERQNIVNYLNLWDHMEEFSRGVVDTRRLVYYLSGTALFLFLATVSLSAKKEEA
jgi:ABC-2 type transport system permease protein